MKQILSKSIVLTGLMGSGKSAIGKVLSEKMGVPLSDTDKIIEKEVGKTIYEIFNESGEKYFRQVEEKVVGRVLDKNAHIISTGGGSILSSKTGNSSEEIHVRLKSDLPEINFNLLFSFKVKCKDEPVFNFLTIS